MLALKRAKNKSLRLFLDTFIDFKNQNNIDVMKEKKDCKSCGVPLKDWQIKQGYDMCLECYREGKKTPK